ncbi:MAG: DEAD/DEAH box helicase [Flavobacteriales bacterium]
MIFEQLKFSNRFINSIQEAGIEDLNKDQVKIIKRFKSGRNAAIKTQLQDQKEEAYLMGLIHQLSHAQGHVARALVLLPNKEAVSRVNDCFQELCGHTDLRSIDLASGLDQTGIVERLEAGFDIIFATPGKVWNIFMSNLIKFNDIKYFVVDNVDEQFDMNYQGELQQIQIEIPIKAQHVFFSEQFYEKAKTWIESNLEFVEFFRCDKSLQKTKIEQEQQLYPTPNNHTKVRLVKHLVQMLEPDENMLIYTRSSSASLLLSQYLEKNTIGSFGFLHPNISDEKIEHDVELFNNQQLNLLICPKEFISEIDLKEVKHLVFFDMPLRIQDFVEFSMIEDRIEDGENHHFATEEEAFNWMELDEQLELNFKHLSLPKGTLVDEKKLSIIEHRREAKAQLFSKGNALKDTKLTRHAGPKNTRKITKVKKKR